MKEKDLHIRISETKLKALKKLADKEYRKVTAIVDRAIDNYLRLKKVEV